MSLELRSYQKEILATAIQYNTLVVLPTGLGKTAIAMALSEQRIRQYPSSKVLILAPTKPLVEQHYATFTEHVPDALSLGVILTGRTKPENRAKQFASSTYIFSTPQTIENDLLSRRISLSEVSLLVVDEAHRTTGEYAYVSIVSTYKKQSKYERILALTASPGSNKTVIEEVVANTGVEKIEVRATDHPQVVPYLQTLDVTYEEVALSDELQSLITSLKRFLDQKKQEAESLGIVRDLSYSKGQLLAAQRQVQALLREGKPEPEAWTTISIIAEILKAEHALELLESQSLHAANQYFSSLLRHAERNQSKAVKNLMSDPVFKAIILRSQEFSQKGIEHPKLLRAVSMIKLERAKNPDKKIIVFNQFRDSAQRLVELLGSSARLFVGQQKKGETGLSQKEQKALLDEFRNGSFPILVATAVGEEGLDIPAVDLVLFYEPVPSAIRTIQRRGRTGRHDSGRVIVFVAKGTRDEGYRWSAHHKEKRMYRALTEVKNNSYSQPVQQTLSSVDEVEIIADSREKSSGVLKALRQEGVSLQLQSLPVGDYLLSNRVCVEFKYSDDFVDSLLDGRLFSQLSRLVQYQRPLIIVQGTDWYSVRNVHPNAIRGALSAIAVGFGIPILSTQNDHDTASLLKTIALRERKEGVASAQTILSGRPQTIQEELVFFVAQIPSVGPVLAARILEHFGSVKKLVYASVDAIAQIDGIGKKKAQEIYGFFIEDFTHKK